MKLRRRATILRLFERLSAYMAGQIRYTAAPIAELLAGAADEQEFAPLRTFLKRFSLQGDWREAFCKGMQQDFAGQGLETADISLIRAWGEGLGSTDVAGQMEHCRQFEQQLGERADEARQQAMVKGKLYTSLGVAGGLTVTLLWL